MSSASSKSSAFSREHIVIVDGVFGSAFICSAHSTTTRNPFRNDFRRRSIISLTLFYKDKAGPGLPEGLSEAVHTFFFAASGFFAILEDTRPTGPGQDMRTAAEWKALSFGLAWARSQRTEAGQSLSLEEKEALSRALINPYFLPLLPTWAGQMTAAGKARQGARFAVWGALVYLLEAAPFLEDGETEGLLCELL